MDYGNKKITIISDVRVDNYDNSGSCGDDSIQQYFSNFNEDDFDVSCSSNSSTPLFTSVVNDEPICELIIECVRVRPALWNIRDNEFKNKIIRTRLWEEVTSESNLEVNPANIAFVRKQWDTVKATYLRSNKRGESGKKGGVKKEYKYSKVLSFLDDTAEPRRSIELGGLVSGDEESSGSVDYGAYFDAAPTTTSRKRTAPPQLNLYQEESLKLKRRYVEAVEKIGGSEIPSTCTSNSPNSGPTDSEVDGFLKSLKPRLKGLSVLLWMEAQQNILKSVSDAWKIQETKF